MAKEEKTKVASPTLIKGLKGRISFPYFFKKDQFDRYSGALIVDLDTPEGKDANSKIEAAIIAAAKAKWPGKGKDGNPKYKSILKKLRNTGKVCYLEGDEDREEYADKMVLKASNVQRVKVKDRSGQEELSAEDGVIYSGCNVSLIVDIWAQDNDFGRRINASLKGAQFWKDNEAFTGGGVAQDEDFEDLSDGSDEDDEEDEKPKSKKKKRPVDEDDEDSDLA